MNFTVIDFETANRHRCSACELGITVVKNYEIIAAKSWLFKPANDFFEGINISIHALDMVKIYLESLGILDFGNIRDTIPTI